MSEARELHHNVTLVVRARQIAARPIIRQLQYCVCGMGMVRTYEKALHFQPWSGPMLEMLSWNSFGNVEHTFAVNGKFLQSPAKPPSVQIKTWPSTARASMALALCFGR